MIRYQDIPVTQSKQGKSYRETVIYPAVPNSEADYYIITTGGDRYDTLAQQFYGDTTLWWIIAAANNSERGSLFVEPGIQLRVPGNVEDIINSFRELNK